MFVQASQMCTKSRAKIVVVVLTLVAVPVGCVISHTYFDLSRDFILIIISALNLLLPVTVLVINAMLIREVRRAANNAAANLGLQQHHQSTSSNSAVPTVMLVTTSLVYVLLRGTPAMCLLIGFLISSVFFHYFYIFNGFSCFLFAYNFYVYSVTGKQFRSELRTLFCRSSSSAAAGTTTGRLSLLPSVSPWDDKMSTSQRAAMLCGLGVKAGMV